MTVVLIPALDPDVRLVDLVRSLRAQRPQDAVIIVDDGSADAATDVFAAAAASGAIVLTHDVNRGKGAALRTGIREAMARFPGHAVVTADADGQHTPADIDRVASRLTGTDRAIVLGTRAFTGVVPLRSRVGNRASSAAFALASGRRLGDTQTGLRALPVSALPWATTVSGDRFEYEFRVLLHARSAGFSLIEEPIATVYEPGNASSHFRPIADSLRVWAPLARFAASGLAAFLIDTIALLVLQALTGSLLLSVVLARLASASANFAINRRLVFARGRDVPLRTAVVRYLSLAGVLLAANFGLLTALTDTGMSLWAAKLLTDATLFVVSFAVQRAVVFAPPSEVSSTRSHPKAAALRISNAGE